jgi:hypothetical protein
VKPFFLKRQEYATDSGDPTLAKRRPLEHHLIRKGHDNEKHPDRRKLFRHELFEIGEMLSQYKTL